MTVRLDGAAVMNHTLAVDEIAALAGGTGAGLYGSNASIQFDDLRVTTPRPA